MSDECDSVNVYLAIRATIKLLLRRTLVLVPILFSKQNKN